MIKFSIYPAFCKFFNDFSFVAIFLEKKWQLCCKALTVKEIYEKEIDIRSLKAELSVLNYLTNQHDLSVNLLSSVTA